MNYDRQTILNTLLEVALIIPIEDVAFDSKLHTISFESLLTVNNNNSIIYVLPTNVRAVGRTNVLNEIGYIAQILYNKTVYVISDYVRSIEHIADNQYTITDIMMPKNNTVLGANKDIVVLLDDVSVQPNTLDLLYKLFSQCKCYGIPVMGYLSC